MLAHSCVKTHLLPLAEFQLCLSILQLYSPVKDWALKSFLGRKISKIKWSSYTHQYTYFLAKAPNFAKLMRFFLQISSKYTQFVEIGSLCHETHPLYSTSHTKNTLEQASLSDTIAKEKWIYRCFTISIPFWNSVTVLFVLCSSSWPACYKRNTRPRPKKMRYFLKGLERKWPQIIAYYNMIYYLLQEEAASWMEHPNATVVTSP